MLQYNKTIKIFSLDVIVENCQLAIFHNFAIAESKTDGGKEMS